MSHLPRLTPEDINYGAQRICETVADKTPFFIGRNGTVELETLFYWFAYRRGTGSLKPYPAHMANTMARNAGVWPATDSSLDAWAVAYADALGLVDGLAAGWYDPYRNVEAALLETFAPTAFTTPLRSLEPYYVEPSKRWTRALAGRTVAVVSSFGASIERQMDMPEAANRIWSSLSEPDTILPPTTKWRAVRTYYSPAIATDGNAGWPPAVRNWRDAVEWTAARVSATGASVAIIGCGGLGMLIAAKLKTAGISAFVLGGATQVLFGMKGGRWASHQTISKFWNRWWIWPSREETPAGADAIERACYWGTSGASSGKRSDAADSAAATSGAAISAAATSGAATSAAATSAAATSGAATSAAATSAAATSRASTGAKIDDLEPVEDGYETARDE